jgi:hypothetical protein
MADQPQTREPRPQLEPSKIAGSDEASSNNSSAGENTATGTGPCDTLDGTASPNRLTPEEQLALFEKELKENDWGHQPC